MFGQTTVLRRHDRSPWAVLGHAHATSGNATSDHASAAHAKHFAAASLVELWVPEPWFFFGIFFSEIHLFSINAYMA